MAADQYFILSITILHCDDFCIAVSKKTIKARQNEEEVSGYIEKKSNEVSATINSLGTGKEPLRDYDNQDELSEIARVKYYALT